MIRSIVGASLAYRFIVAALAVVLMGAGIFAVRDTPVDIFPEFTPTRVEVQTEAPGLSANEVEELLTTKLEEEFQGGARIQKLQSKTVSGLVSHEFLFEPGTSTVRARQIVQERLTTLGPLTKVISGRPRMVDPQSSTSRVMMIGLSSKNVSLRELSVLARWTIRPALMGVGGVANVAIWGNRDRQLQVLVDPERLAAQGILLDDIIQATGNAGWASPLGFLAASAPGRDGWIDLPQQRLGSEHVLPIAKPQDLARVVVQVRDGVPLRLGDVAEVVEGQPPLIGDAFLNNGPGLLLVVERLPGSNTLAVTRGVDAMVASLQRSVPGVTMDTQVFRAATYVDQGLGNLGASLVIGALLVLLVLAVFLFNWRLVFIAAVAIVLALLAAALVLHLLGVSLNVMVLVGMLIAVGAVVDDAIIDVEHIARRLREPRPAGAPSALAAIVRAASLEVRGALIFATLILVLAVMPVFFLPGLAGRFFQPLALAYALALAASMVVALTITPALSLILLSRVPRQASPLVRGLQGGYDRLLGWLLRRGRMLLAGFAILVVAGVAVLPTLGQELLPTFREPAVIVQWEGAPGTSQPEMARVTALASAELRSLPGVRSVTTQIGRAVLGDQVVGINASQLWVSLDPKANYEATLAAVRATAEGYPGLIRKVQTYLNSRIREALTGSGDAIVVRVYGPDIATLRAKAEEVRQALVPIKGLVDLQVEPQVEEPNLEIKVDLPKAARYGLRPGEVRRAASTFVSGLPVGLLFENQKVFDVVVWSTPQTRQSLTSIRELPIDTPSGARVRLGDVADVQVVPKLRQIKHEGPSRYVDVTANVRGRDLGAVSRDVEGRLKPITFPLQHHAKLLGEYVQQQETQQRLLIVGAVALVGIFLLLQAALGSWRLATVALLALPVALVGSLLAAFFGSRVLSLGSLVGFLAVLGIAARNGIMLFAHYQHLEREEGLAFGLPLVLRGARERLGPVLMTALATAGALLPLAVAGDIAGQEIAYPMALVILGGVVTSTLLTLVFLPALYLRFGANPANSEEIHAQQPAS
jgi:CzcA family heavy metal efflux pump